MLDAPGLFVEALGEERASGEVGDGGAVEVAGEVADEVGAGDPGREGEVAAAARGALDGHDDLDPPRLGGGDRHVVADGLRGGGHGGRGGGGRGRGRRTCAAEGEREEERRRSHGRRV